MKLLAKNKISQQKGLGDTIDFITRKTGIKAAVKTVFGDDCGCANRREYLNRILPYK